MELVENLKFIDETTKTIAICCFEEPWVKIIFLNSKFQGGILFSKFHRYSSQCKKIIINGKLYFFPCEINGRLSYRRFKQSCLFLNEDFKIKFPLEKFQEFLKNARSI